MVIFLRIISLLQFFFRSYLAELKSCFYSLHLLCPFTEYFFFLFSSAISFFFLFANNNYVRGANFSVHRAHLKRTAARKVIRFHGTHYNNFSLNFYFINSLVRNFFRIRILSPVSPVSTLRTKEKDAEKTK